MQKVDPLPNGTVLKNGFRLERTTGYCASVQHYTAVSERSGERVVIREFVPQGVAVRAADGTVTARPGVEDAFIRLKQRFRHDCDVLTRIQDVRLPRVQPAWDECGTVYQRFEEVQGPTLEDRIRLRQWLTDAEAQAVLASLLALLETLHADQVSCGGVDVSSIVLTAQGPKLGLFGFDPNDGLEGQQRDLRGLALSVYQGLTGVRSVGQPGGVTVPIRTLRPGLHTGVAQVIDRALGLNRDAPPSSARELLDQLSRPHRKPSGLIRPILWAGLLAAVAWAAWTALPLRELFVSRSDGQAPRHGCVWNAVLPWDRATSQRPDVWLVPLDDDAYTALARVKPQLEARLQVRINLAKCFTPSRWRFDLGWRQYPAELLVNSIRTEYPIEVNAQGAPVIGVTSDDMFITSLDWAWAFAYRDDAQFGVVSTAHMRDGLTPTLDQGRFDERLRKMLMKNIGVLHFRLPQSTDPGSVLYAGIRSAADLDRVEERY